MARFQGPLREKPATSNHRQGRARLDQGEAIKKTRQDKGSAEAAMSCQAEVILNKAGVMHSLESLLLV